MPTLGVTPMVAAQVGDERLARDLGTWLGGQMWRAEGQRWHWWLDAPTLVGTAGGADRDWTVRPSVPDASTAGPDEVVHDGVLVGDSDVVAFARDRSVAYRVWAPSTGYPGDGWYRDFHARTADHAEDLHGLLREVLDPRPGGLVVAAYDTELFGHWWYQGPVWLEAVLRRIAADPRLRTTTLASRRERHPPTRRLHLPESSWGYGKGHGSWVTPATRPMWQRIAATERRARRAVQVAAAERLCDMLEHGEVDAVWLEDRNRHVPAPADPSPIVRALLADERRGSPA